MIFIKLRIVETTSNFYFHFLLFKDQLMVLITNTVRGTTSKLEFREAKLLFQSHRWERREHYRRLVKERELWTGESGHLTSTVTIPHTHRVDVWCITSTVHTPYMHRVDVRYLTSTVTISCSYGLDMQCGCVMYYFNRAHSLYRMSKHWFPARHAGSTLCSSLAEKVFNSSKTS